MARRRRKRRGFWFPNQGTVGPEGADDDDDYGLYIQLEVSGSGGANAGRTRQFITDLTFDRPLEDDRNETNRLNVVVGGEYILRRIVGRLFASRGMLSASNAEQRAPAIQLTCGFFVARAADSGVNNADAPIGTETENESIENYCPAGNQNIREPWIWHKRWILGSTAEVNNDNGAPGINTVQTDPLGLMSYPRTTMGYGSKFTDGSIDAKTIRRVSNDDRLWFVAAARFLNNAAWVGEGTSPFDPAISGQTNPTLVAIHLDYRLFGHFTSTRNRGTM